MLQLESVSRQFGGVRALHDVSFEVRRGEICGLIGPNGAGKTTLVNIISGLLRPSSGRIILGDRELTGAAAHQVAAAGIARTFQNIRLFGELSVLENVLVGRHLQRRDTLLEALFALPGARRAEREARAFTLSLLERLGIDHLAALPAGTLAYGDQRRVEIARALALEPAVLLLDEPAAGMNGPETERLAEQLLRLGAHGLTLLVIEHNMNLIMRICDQVAVLNFGMLITAGSPSEVRRNPDVIAAYLGEDTDEVPKWKPTHVSEERTASLLSVSGVRTAYGAIVAVDDVSFDVPKGTVVALIGANGAGKTTTLNTISGVLKPKRGRIIFAGTDITGWRADRVAARGLLQVPEGRQVLAPLTVEENLLMGAYLRRDAEIGTDLRDMYERFPRLEERRNQTAGSLSGGEQQMLAIGRALMGRPKLLMLDEPSLGLAPLIVREVFQIIAGIKAGGTTVLLVEQNARKALEIADFAYVLEGGSVAAAGPAAQLRDDPAVVAAYLGAR